MISENNYKIGVQLGKTPHSVIYECLNIGSNLTYVCEVISMQAGGAHEKYFRAEEEFSSKSINPRCEVKELIHTEH
jgi:hypothetical protein